jgi:glycosyltransferase involved in cell wall biosynthesis
MKIGIAGPISTESIARFIDGDFNQLPLGYSGAPLLGTLIGELLSRGHQVSAYTTSSDLPLDLAQPVVAAGKQFKIYYCPQRKHSLRMNGRNLGRIVDFFGLERRYLEQAIRMDAPDVVHAHWAYEFALAAIASGKPHVVTCHDAPREVLKYMPNIYRFGRYLMARKAMRTAIALTTVSPYMRDLLGCSSIEVIPNPLPPEIAQKAFDLHRQLNCAAPLVVMVANGWGKRKNAEAGMLAFASLRTALGGARLKLYGSDFGAGEAAHRWAVTHKVDAGMQFVGKLPYAALLGEIALGDVLLHPSLEESFGMVVAEAMALGVPVVGGQASGAVPWVIDAGGVVADVTNVEAIAQALKQVISNPEGWQRMRALACQSAQSRFAPNVVADAYERLYQKQLSKGSR